MIDPETVIAQPTQPLPNNNATARKASFPDESAYPRSQDGTEPIRPNSSVGINSVLGMIKNFSAIDKRPRWGMYLINAFTMVRNIVSGKLKDGTWTKERILIEFGNEMQSLVTYIDAYHAAFNNKKPVPILFYIPCYDKLPIDARRTFAGEKNDVWEIFKLLASAFPPAMHEISYNQITTKWSVPVGSTQLFPHEALVTAVKNIGLHRKTEYTWGDPIFLLTHCPIDLHIYRKLPVQLVESYQGIIKLPKEFGSKLVPKSTTIPFTSETHRALGDTLQVKPLVTGRKRTELIEAASSKKWMSRSSEGIASDIRSIAGVTGSELSRIKFN